MAIAYIGNTISGTASDRGGLSPTANEIGILFLETDTNRLWQWDGDSWEAVTATDATASVKGVASFDSGDFSVSSGAVSLADNITIAGNLTVSGDTITANTANLLIEDPLMILANGTSGTPANDAGLVIERGSLTNVAMVWDESADEFVFITTSETGGTAGNINMGGYANLQVSTATMAVLNIGGTAVTATAAEINLIDGGTARGTDAIGDGDGVLINDGGTMKMTTVETLAAYLDDEITAMPNLISVGTLGSLTVDDITINGSTISDAGALTIDGGTGITLQTASSGGIRLAEVVGFNGGNASDPPIGKYNDTDTGIFWPTTDTLGITTDGTERLRINASGYMGMADDAPLARLHVAALGNDTTELQSITIPNATNNRYAVGLGSTNVSGEGQRMDFYTGDSGTNDVALDKDDIKMVLTYTGRLGVGVVAPGQPVDVSGGIRASGTIWSTHSDGNKVTQISHNGTLGTVQTSYFSSGASDLEIKTGGTQRLLFGSGGTATFATVVDITDATDASDNSGDTGALRTEGGASIAKKLYVGTDLDVDGTAELDNITIGGSQGSDGQVLTSTGSGVAWESVTGAVSAVANGANNYIATFSSSTALNGEANLTFDGTTFQVGASNDAHWTTTDDSNVARQELWGNISWSSGTSVSTNQYTFDENAGTGGDSLTYITTGMMGAATSGYWRLATRESSSNEHAITAHYGKVGVGAANDPDQALEVGGKIHISGEGSAPSAPADGDGGVLYVKTDGKLYFISNETAETDLTGGGGGFDVTQFCLGWGF